ncbi:SusC/RagA family TonB-linked outer membrane protein [Deminuibacter soli]|uniref:TonB-dependent receptor n=1 Tax=Deminuibacter soli TaxID=2291815 RepID=A0A3E1NGK7_9BACT|nr:TonB-dependent receptor [Deminuibacter soli]RFM27012.1 TonB-dependent receptor [Deminuibacter soli]
MKNRLRCLVSRTLLRLGIVCLCTLLVTGAWAWEKTAAQDLKKTASLNLENMSLASALQHVAEAGHFKLVYDAAQVKKVNYSGRRFSKQPLNAILDSLLAGTSLGYKTTNDLLIVFQQTAAAPFTLKGRVLDNEKNTPVPAASISVKGTNRGTVAGDDGNFILERIAEGDVLVVNSAGFEKQEVLVKDEKVITIRLQASVQNNQELVVVGYGVQKKVNLTGAVGYVDSKAIADKPVANVGQALQGVVPNLNITFGDGHPGSGAKFNVRGTASLTNLSGSPLILIDGVPGDINLMSPADVESISVLKDAASAAIYGARGAYGVILVTTKRAKQGKLTVSYSNNFSWQTPTTKTDFITDGYTAAKLVDSAFIRATGNSYTGYNDNDYAELLKRQSDPSLPQVVIQNRNGVNQYVYYGHTDWWHTMFRNWQPSMEHTLNVSGGNEKVDFMLSGRYYNQKGIFQINQDAYNAYNFRAKINARVTPWLNLFSNTQFSGTDYTYPGWGYNSNFVSITVHALPSYVPVNPDGTATYRTNLNNYTIGDGVFASLLNGKSKGGEKHYDITNTVGFNLNLVKGLTLTGNYTYELMPHADFNRRTADPWSVSPGVIQYVGNDYLKEGSYLDQHHTINLYGTYEKSFGPHNFKAVAGLNQELLKYKTNTVQRSNLLSNDLNQIDLGTGDITVVGNANELALRGYFGRLNYDYKGRYLVEVDGRYDGSSRFPASRRYGFFPSASAGWRISEEAFFAPLKRVISDLKFRGSYGSLGNQALGSGTDYASLYPYVPVMPATVNNWIIDGTKTQTLSVPAPIDPNFTWEKIATLDAGVDLALLKNHFQVSFDWYKRITTDMITPGKVLPAVFGAGSPKQNAADLETKGFDVNVSWRDNGTVAGKPFSYNVGVVLSDYTAEVTRFDNPNKLLSNNYVGQQLGEIWGYKLDGYFASDAAAQANKIDQTFVNKQRLSAPGVYSKLSAGDIRFKDLNGDGIINNGKNSAIDPGDMRRIGNQNPRYSFGINASASWGGFDMAVFFQGIGKQQWYPGNNADKFWGPYSRAYYSFIPTDFPGKIWSPENPNAYFPRLRSYEALNAGGELYTANDKYLQNLAYIRLKNLTFGYSLPASLLRRIGVSKLRFYFSGQNLFTATKLKTKYIDPEQAMPDGDVNGRVYPFFKTYSVGLNMTF